MAGEYLDTCVHETHKCTKNIHSTLHTKKKIILTCDNGGGDENVIVVELNI